MDQVEAVVSPPTRVLTRVGVAGLLLAMLAFFAAVLSPWALAALEPPRPIDEAAVDVAGRIKDRLAARTRGEAYVAPADAEAVGWSAWYLRSVVVAGAASVCIGAATLALGGDRRVGATTVALGAAAIAFQFALIVAAAIVFVLLVGAVLFAVFSGG